MKSQPQNPKFRIILNTFTHAKKTEKLNLIYLFLSKQDKFDEFISPDEGLFERNM